MEQWSHGAPRSSRNTGYYADLSFQNNLSCTYRVYVRSVGVYSGIMYGCVRYVLRVARVDSGWGVLIVFVAS